MFDALVKELASRFGLGNQAESFVRTILEYITSPNQGGLAGIQSRLQDAGLGSAAQSWLGGSAVAQAVSPTQVEQVFGGSSGLMSQLSSKFGMAGSTVSSALAFALPAIISKLTPNGSWSAAVPGEALAYLGGARASVDRGVAAAGTAAAATGSGLKRWLPWLVLLAALLLLLAYCNRKPVAEVPPPSQEVAAPADTAVVPALEPAAVPSPVVPEAVIPVGAGALSAMFEGRPSLKVYFDTGKADVAAEFANLSKPLVDYAAANPDAKLVVSGFNDPTGDAAANAALSKHRAEAVAAALKTAGVAESSILLEKPADATGTGDSNAESRRVEVVIRQ